MSVQLFIGKFVQAGIFRFAYNCVLLLLFEVQVHGPCWISIYYLSKNQSRPGQLVTQLFYYGL